MISKKGGRQTTTEEGDSGPGFKNVPIRREKTPGCTNTNQIKFDIDGINTVALITPLVHFISCSFFHF